MVAQALPWFGVQEDQVRQVSAYLFWRAPSLVFVLLMFAARNYLQAVGRTAALVVATVSANVLNLVLDLWLVLGGEALPSVFGPLRAMPALGATGAAVATLLCAVVQWLIVAVAIHRIPPVAAVTRAPVWADLQRSVRTGLPIALHRTAEIGVFALAGVLAAGFSPASVSAHQIAISYASLSFTIALGFGNAGSVRVGWAVGARDTARARLAGFTAIAAGAGLQTLSALGFALFPQALARFANAPADVLHLAVPLLMVSAAFQIFDGVQGVGAGVLRGAGDARFTFLANLVGHYTVGLPVALGLGFTFGYGVVGLWWGLCIGLAAVAVALLVRFHRISARPLETIEALPVPP